MRQMTYGQPTGWGAQGRVDASEPGVRLHDSFLDDGSQAADGPHYPLPWEQDLSRGLLPLREREATYDSRSSPEDRVTQLAAAQHGVVTRDQLFGAGLTRDAVDHRVCTGRLRVLHRGVYLVGPLEAAHTKEMAAVLASGPDSMVSHASAAVLWELLPSGGRAAPVHVTVRGRNRPRRPGIRGHRALDLRSDEVTKIDGIPVTTPGRTLLDLAAMLVGPRPADRDPPLAPRDVEQAVAGAERRNLLTRDRLLALLERRPHRPGVSFLRALLEREGDPAFTRSEAEELFLALVRKAQLPEPESNVRVDEKVGRGRVDFLWRSERVVVEVDGYKFHSSRSQFEEDRLRDQNLAAHGFRAVRVTWRQLDREPDAVLARVARTLGAAAGRIASPETRRRRGP